MSPLGTALFVVGCFALGLCILYAIFGREKNAGDWAVVCFPNSDGNPKIVGRRRTEGAALRLRDRELNRSCGTNYYVWYMREEDGGSPI